VKFVRYGFRMFLKKKAEFKKTYTKSSRRIFFTAEINMKIISPHIIRIITSGIVGISRVCCWYGRKEKYIQAFETKT